MRTAYFDLVGGAAGDMLLGALLDAGAPKTELRTGLARLAVPFELELARAAQGALDCARVVVRPGPESVERGLADVLAIVDGAGLPERAATRARRTFELLAAAEGQVHGIDPAEVHFHEVGAVDAIVDVVGCCLALELLGVERIEASPFPLGRGRIRAAHGLLPLPGPAVLELMALAGAPGEPREEGGEYVTPTGAALLCALAARFGRFPALRVERVGYGSGLRQAAPEALPNLVRVVIGAAPEVAAPGEVVVLEANLDDQSAELTAYLAERLLAAGALDAFLTPVLMKKGRPGVVITAVADPARAGLLEDLLLRESSSLGVRRRGEARSTLPRSSLEVETPWGRVRVKLAERPDGRRTGAPEFEDCARVARERGVPLQEVYGAALRAAGL